MRKLFERTIHRILRPAFEKYADQILADERILQNPYVAAKHLFPLRTGQGYYIIQGRPLNQSDETPVPPAQFREGYGESDTEYLVLGREHMEAMLGILRGAGAQPETFSRVLDFGCAAARILRFFPQTASTAELWGVDLKAETINWCQRNFSAPFHFAANTTHPHLPFEDDYFDLIYASSVFTHIADLADAWFLELRRIVRKGGYIFLTINDKHSIDLLFTKYDRENLRWFTDMIRQFDKETGVLAQDYDCFSFEGGRWGGFPVPHVFHNVDYLRAKWSPLAELVSVTEEAFRFQTALLFQK
jgi:SAM-dependent methyltransferase